MKNLKSTLIIAGLLFVGIISFFIYNRQQETQFLEFEGYKISNIQEKVDALYNEDKTDLAEDISEEHLSEIRAQITEVDKKEYSERNETLLNEAIQHFEVAEEMYALQKSVKDLFEDETSKIIKRNVSEQNMDNLTKQLENFNEKTSFYKRHSQSLTEAKNQLEEIELASDFVNGLFEEGELKENLTQEELDEAMELIDRIKNKEVKESLLAKIDGVQLASVEETDVEEELLEDELDEVELEMEDELEEESIEQVQATEPERERPRRREQTQAPQTSKSSSQSTQNSNSNANSSASTQTSEPDPEPQVEVTTEREPIPYLSIVTEFSSSLPRGEQEVIREGVNGERITTTETITYPNGEVEVKQTEDIIQPQSEHIREGILETTE